MWAKLVPPCARLDIDGRGWMAAPQQFLPSVAIVLADIVRTPMRNFAGESSRRSGLLAMSGRRREGVVEGLTRMSRVCLAGESNV